MLIQEVILEDFMSYEYARVPFRPRVNVVCGPNGSGKSSLLLAISVALGQTYTERSKKLSDLIRWGKDQARVTIILDNTKKGKRRPVPRFRKDQIFLTRCLRRDGKYWFELDNRAATKAEVARLLSKLGVDPDNMLIIMHQNMVEEFTTLSSQEKLCMVEAAVGLESYRKNVLKARKKITRISSQESSIGKLLESAEQTLNYWRQQFDRYQEKKQLQTKRRFLEREFVWAEAAKKEDILKDLEINIRKEQDVLNQIMDETKAEMDVLENLQELRQKLNGEWRILFEDRLSLEREKAKSDSAISLYGDFLKESEILEEAIQSGNPSPLLDLTLQKTFSNRFRLLKSQILRERIQNLNQQSSKIMVDIDENRRAMETTKKDVEKASSQILDDKVKLALLSYREKTVKNELQKLKSKLGDARDRLKEAVDKAEKVGQRIAAMKNASEILDEIRITDGHLAALSDVSEDVERMYESYSKLYIELKEKARVVAENREKTLEEIKARMQAWRTVIRNLLDRINQKYQKILKQVQAQGELELTNENDIEEAGLRILIGFKGSKPVPLNAYTQSGGERSTVTISFLLALQQHIRSSFRAVDEYDIHMDPKNREMIASMLISTVEDADSQYIVLTPSQITFAKEEVNIITVQNIMGKSVAREVG